MQTVSYLSRMAFLPLMLAVSIAGLPLKAQSKTCGKNGLSGPSSWRATPVTANAHPDTVSAAVRKLRDEYWMKLMPVPRGDEPLYLDPDQIIGTSMPGGSGPEPYDAKKYWIVGTFLEYDVHEVAGATIYTEIHLRVDRLLGTHRKVNAPKVGSTLDIGLGGGCVATSHGDVHDYLPNSGTAMQPGHRYILMVSPVEVEGLYREISVLADVTGGVAMPVGEAAVAAANSGRWKYTGLSEEAAIDVLNQDAAKNN